MSEAPHNYHVFETAIGFCAIAWTDAGVARFQLPTKSAEAADRLMRRRAFGAEPGAPPEVIAAVVEAAKLYFAGEEMDFSQVQLDLAGEDAFFTRIYEALRRVGWGRTTTYGALAKKVGAGREAARAVGEAMAKNPAPLIIPCHRVLAAGLRDIRGNGPMATFAACRRIDKRGSRVSLRTALAKVVDHIRDLSSGAHLINAEISMCRSQMQRLQRLPLESLSASVRERAAVAPHPQEENKLRADRIPRHE
jgi:methylated-DNA-[protein]-cysteine S-methyltransferase